MDYQEFKPKSELSAFVKLYWTLEVPHRVHRDLMDNMDAKEGQEFVLNLPFSLFWKVCAIADIKKRGTLVEHWLRRHNGWSEAPGKEYDAQDGDTNIEIKSSIVTPLKNSQVTFRSIDPDNGAHIIHFIVFDFSNKSTCDVHKFSMTPEQFKNINESEITPRMLKRGEVSMNVNSERFFAWQKKFPGRFKHI